MPNLDANIKSQLNFACIGAINTEYPNADVNIHIVPQQGNTAGKTNTLNQIKNVLAVASGKGGVGKSTVSVNMALGLAQKGYKVGLIDADLYGPSIPTMLGLQGQRPKVKLLYGQNKLEPLEAHGIYTISIGFIIEPEQAVVLRGPRLGGIIKQFINDCLWPELDFLVIDLPPGTGDIQLTLVQTIPVTGVVMVTTPQDVAVIDAVKAMNMFQLDNVK
ncbi:Mrp/NBP35 family ATP-binding protein, partial [Saprospiraceae bacterium]|nr:Mrp/NBP35 family ATP-binding protein [Saprospiraceae bacterium]